MENVNTDLLNVISEKVKGLNEKDMQTQLIVGGIHALNAMSGTLDSNSLALTDATLKAETSQTSVEESKGLCGLSKENVLDIWTYVKIGLALPTDNASAITMLGYAEDSVFSKRHPTFAPSKFVEFYTPIKTHAQGWKPLQDSMISIGNEVSVYGNTFVSNANFILKFIEDMDSFWDGTGTVDNTVALSPDDEKKKVRLTDQLAKWQQETNDHKKNTSDLLEKLKEYNTVLTNTIHPSIDFMVSNLDKLNVGAEMTTLKTDIDDLDSQIKAKQSEYDMNVGLAFTGAAGMLFPPLGIITWALTGGIFGAIAEGIREELNNLKVKKEEKQAQYDGLNAVSSYVTSVKNGVSNLNMAVTNAIAGLNLVYQVWDLIGQYIGGARKELSKANNQSDLFNFDKALSGARDAWAKVPDLASKLVTLFNEAYKEAHGE